SARLVPTRHYEQPTKRALDTLPSSPALLREICSVLHNPLLLQLPFGGFHDHPANPLMGSSNRLPRPHPANPLLPFLHPARARQHQRPHLPPPATLPATIDR